MQEKRNPDVNDRNCPLNAYDLLSRLQVAVDSALSCQGKSFPFLIGCPWRFIQAHGGRVVADLMHRRGAGQRGLEGVLLRSQRKTSTHQATRRRRSVDSPFLSLKIISALDLSPDASVVSSLD
ncbi:hypothetical protein CGRA01v4_08662 [Colletotrichum graminicola]|nr:hypothetical protein CGRA01v4_08662 [Colletotrichum graminicola]